ncbi:hypothetical protein PspLS_00125 [Pyricularia sp. CBS 133598]|nr:hypothetical protein PspLS_00125 [Pyricularia sp. CBS 133598]
MRIQPTFTIFAVVAAYFPTANADPDHKDCVIRRRINEHSHHLYHFNRKKNVDIDGYQVFIKEDCSTYPVILGDQTIIEGMTRAAWLASLET